MIKSPFFILVLFGLMVSCSSGDSQNNSASSVTINCDEITAENSDHCLRLNQIQVLGTHNSYKLKPTERLVNELNNYSPGWAENIEYGHRTLIDQLEELGIRKIELDVFADPDGGLFAEPFGALLSEDEEFIRPDEMMEPGFKVLHVQDIDYRSHCLTLTGCLGEIRRWSDQNRNHLPIMIMLEMKDSTPNDRDGARFTEAIPITEENIFDADDEVWSVFSQDRVITPDDVRGDFDTLEEAILSNGWPTLAESRGKILFALDNTGSHRDAYLSESPRLEGRVMFISSEPGEPTAGFIKMNNALDDHEQIREYIEMGYLIRTRSDIPTREARSGDTTRRDLALNSGAQYVSTDYPEPSPFGSGFIVTLPGAEGPGRCNPVSAPANCNNDWIVE